MGDFNEVKGILDRLNFQVYAMVWPHLLGRMEPLVPAYQLLQPMHITFSFFRALQSVHLQSSSKDMDFLQVSSTL